MGQGDSIHANRPLVTCSKDFHRVTCHQELNLQLQRKIRPFLLLPAEDMQMPVDLIPGRCCWRCFLKAQVKHLLVLIPQQAGLIAERRSTTTWDERHARLGVETLFEWQQVQCGAQQSAKQGRIFQSCQGNELCCPATALHLVIRGHHLASVGVCDIIIPLCTQTVTLWLALQ